MQALMQQSRAKMAQPPEVDQALLAQMLLGMAPGAGDVMAARDSQTAGQAMVERLRAGDYGGAASSGLESLGHGLGALPMVPAFGAMIRKVKPPPEAMQSAKQALSDLLAQTRAENRGWGDMARFENSPHFWSSRKSLRAIEPSRMVDDSGEQVFWRGTNRKEELADLQKGKPLASKNFATGEGEVGLSVMPTMEYADVAGYQYVIPVKGKVVGAGSDGEPLLAEVIVAGQPKTRAQVSAIEKQARLKRMAILQSVADELGVPLRVLEEIRGHDGPAVRRW